MNVRLKMKTNYYLFMEIKEFSDLFEKKCNDYIDKLDQLYGYLLEPFVSFDITPKPTDLRQMPKPSFISTNDSLKSSTPSHELFEL